MFCKHLPKEERASQAVSYPNKISSIQSAVVMIQCRHHPNCTEVPTSVRKELNRLKRSGTASTSGVKRQDCKFTTYHLIFLHSYLFCTLKTLSYASDNINRLGGECSEDGIC